MASKCYESPSSSPEMNNTAVNNQIVPVDAIRILGIHKRAGEPLVSILMTAGFSSSLNSRKEIFNMF